MPRRMAGRAVRTMGRTAMVAGTATAVSGKVARNQQQKMMAEQAAMAPPPPAAAPPPPAAEPAADPYEELKKLGELKEMGILSEEEFNAKKAQILGL